MFLKFPSCVTRLYTKLLYVFNCKHSIGSSHLYRDGTEKKKKKLRMVNIYLFTYMLLNCLQKGACFNESAKFKGIRPCIKQIQTVA